VLRERAALLPYDRDSLAPGEELPVRDERFRRALLAARSVHFDGRETNLGDALLGLAHLEAVRDAAELLGVGLTVTASPDIARLLQIPATNRPEDHALRISMAPGRVGPLMPKADLPAFRTATRVYADMPARRYLNVERRVGVRLPRNEGFLPVLPSRPAAARDRPLICYISASSWPDKKDYSVRRFARVAERINAITGRELDHVLVRGLDDPRRGHPPLRPLPFEPNDIAALLSLFAQATLIIGNDTGLIHAAAMTSSPTRLGVIGIYGRHSYLRYTTGDPRQYAIATPFAQAVALAMRSPHSDKRYPRAAAVRRIRPEFIAEYARRLLEG